MIVYYSSWGVGNELFQYAYLKSIVKEGEKILCLGGMDELDDGFDLNDNNFSILHPNPTMNSIIRILICPVIFWLAKKRLFNFHEQLTDNSGALINQISKTNGLIPISIVKTCFFQSESFFDPNKIRCSFKDSYMSNALKIYNSFPKDRTKVFVHVRRGDYLNQVCNGKKGVNLPFSYYQTTINLIEEEVIFPFYIFLSDDREYVEQAFHFIKDSDKYISDNYPIVDLCLMSLCKYGIAANSSFSWWGSYFMKNKKKVYFPRYWFGWRSKVESHMGIQPSWSEIINIEN